MMLISNIALLLLEGYIAGGLLFLLIAILFSFQVKRNEAVSVTKHLITGVLSCAYFFIFWPIVLHGTIVGVIRLRR